MRLPCKAGDGGRPRSSRLTTAARHAARAGLLALELELEGASRLCAALRCSGATAWTGAGDALHVSEERKRSESEAVRAAGWRAALDTVPKTGETRRQINIVSRLCSQGARQDGPRPAALSTWPP